MTVRLLVPSRQEANLSEILARLRDDNKRPAVSPFSPEVMEFCEAFSRTLFQDPEARLFPELQALAFWMRKAELVRMREEFHAMESERLLLVPRGLVFHVPPTNVETMFVYSWLLSALVGNRNIVRISPQASAQTDTICRICNQILAASPIVSDHVMIQYQHESEITAAISRVCDVRVLWGGDASVNALRQFPLAPHAKELTFPNRYSLAAVRADAYLNASDQERQQLAADFYNDVYWFDQMACSSPRLLVWCGVEDACANAASIFFDLLEVQIARKGYDLEAGARIDRFTFACRAIADGGIEQYRECGAQLVVLDIEQIETLRGREHCGGGLLFQFRSAGLGALIQFVERRDQTLTYYGFDREDLNAFARALNGAGLDRLVPIGQALSFSRYWDGYDLLRELTRCVYLG